MKKCKTYYVHFIIQKGTKMKSIRKFVTLLPVLCILLTLSGCGVTYCVREGRKEMQEKYDNVIGLCEEDTIKALGMPRNISYVGNIKVFQYYDNLGQRIQLYHQITMCNRVDVYFADDHVVSWRGRVQR